MGNKNILKDKFETTRKAALALLILLLAVPTAAKAASMPVVVEVFTSTNCPTCPATERKLSAEVQERSDLLVVLEHVDYWNKGAVRPDPYSSPEITQRQYDYSNQLSKRPGEVFTPQPILDGHVVASPPMWLNWNAALSKALSTSQNKAALKLVRAKDGDVIVDWPKSLATNSGAMFDVVALGLIADEKLPNLWRATGINTVPAMEPGQRLKGPTLPKGNKLLVLLQETGGGKIYGMGVTE